LPTAPRSTRILEDDSIPHEGPFIARVANLPFDTNEDEIIEFFANRDIQVKEMRLARDDNNDKLRGFGQIEFDCREDLINAIMIHDAMIQNRRIRIEVASESDGRDGRTVRRRFDYSGGGNNESTNWREKKDYGFETVSDNRRDGRDNRRGGDYQRSSFQNRHDNNNNNNDEMSNWRMGERQVDSPPPERRRAGGGERGGFDRNDRRRDGGGRDRYERKPPMDEERPVLKLQPRTKPLPVLVFPKEEETVKAERKPSSLNGDAENHDDSADEKEKVEKPAAPKPKPIPNAVVFGDAKPVDTAAREREIEAKLDQERQARNDANRNEREMSRNVEQTEVKKDIIVIKTEKTRLQEEANNWRKYDESSEPPRNRDNRDNRDNGRRLTDRRSMYT
jgi:translation initiation factor 4B